MKIPEKITYPLYFAAVGDVHGHMHKMVDLVQATVEDANVPISFILQVGDFQPIRDENDLKGMAVPERYREKGDYHEFHFGKAEFPWPVYFIGGNHEPYGYLDTMLEGKEITWNCKYMGRTGCENLYGLRIVGLTGIHGESRFKELRPDIAKIRSTKLKHFTYFNQMDLDKAISYNNADILLIHDWPKGIGVPRKSGENTEPSSGKDTVGNTYANDLINALRPRLVLCGHMHWAHFAQITRPDGGVADVHCMADVLWGGGAVKIFRVDEGGTIILVQSSAGTGNQRLSTDA